MLLIGLVFIAIGTGSIKPNLAAFGGDQFKLPAQAAQLATYFSIYYFGLNLGPTMSILTTPMLREDVHCFGRNDCYPLAFGVPAAVLFLSICI